MNIRKITTVLLGIFATIILGAIGSGVWEKLLSPAIGYISNLIVSGISYLSVSYSNSIYTKAATLQSVELADRAGIFMLLLLMLYWFYCSALSLKENRIIEGLLTYLKETLIGWSGLIISGATIVVLVILMSQETLVRDIQRYSLKHIEIVRPYVGEKNYFVLRSDYLKMKNKKDFNTFITNLEKYYSDNSMALPKFSPR